MNVLLLVVGAVFLANVLIGYKRGFLKIALSLVVMIASILLVGLLVSPISGVIQKTTPIREVVQEKLTEMIESAAGVSGDMLSDIEIPREQQIIMIEGMPFPDSIKSMLLENNNDEAYAALGATNFIEYIGAYATKLIADIIAFVVAWIVVTVIARIIMGVLGIVGKIPVIGGINRLAGAIVGIGFAFIIVWILFVVVTLLYNTPVGQACMEDIAASPILTKLYNGNVLMKFITKF